MRKLSVLGGNANPSLASEICQRLGIHQTEVFVGRFSEGEIRVHIKENIRGQDVFIVQPTCPPVNDNLMELLILIDAARRASADRITAVVPYYGYARQDRKDQPRVPITAKLVANLIVAAGVNRVLTMDLHASQLQGFFDIPVDHLYAINVLSEYFKDRKISDLVIVPPDVGGIKMARAYAKRLNASLAIVDKRRMSPEKTEVMNILGEVKDKNVVIVDDIIATASSLIDAVAALKSYGAKGVYAAASHGVFSGPAKDRIVNCKELLEVVVTNSVPLKDGTQHPKIKQLSIAPLLAEAIARTHNAESISSLFEEIRN
ncbi:MAG: ribose-phosphate pyrophosphokinase [Candidatus Omnitrophica bacterium]|nr:ribose-phosphate pyrophosphokinase [Candidatus Omnitrophota bacterium]MDE2010017.1 ribose-phosphate pyrophosphokinase [Candidatus Omnitrophota bacterium]MDE2215049.1 ribose-phosphate pyrophosphokinase [Candidatus Omnitrophota bacterium]MDE2231749.1 ribose-phosphate pyrophosphokinase [Candidatus Omnitrophota bacterium]